MTSKLEESKKQPGEDVNAHLFSELQIRGVKLRNRIAVSPMCQYSSVYGAVSDWHLVHLGSRAVGGAGLVMVEATAVEPRGRITTYDLGIWDDKHIDPLKALAGFIADQGAAPAIQLAHAGRKACTARPWEGGKPLGRQEGRWQPIGPSALAFDKGYQVPAAATDDDILNIVELFRVATKRAVSADFKLIELHSAHGYLLHSFLSPLSNTRTDKYGGSLDNRMRLLLQIVSTVRKEMPDDMPLLVRISATDWAEGGWDLEQSIQLGKRLARAGVDLIDCSSGGLVPDAKVEVSPGYQVPFSDAIRREAAVMTAAVGMIKSAPQADEIIKNGQADLVLLAREMLRDPYWALHAAETLGHKLPSPPQYVQV